MSSLKKYRFKKVAAVFFSFFLFTLSVSADSWVLAAQKFSFKQQKTQSEAASQSAAILTQLILEQISSGETRVVPEREILNRELDALQTKRLSLFLQLSKEYQSRDALVLTTLKQKELLKLLKEEDKKIKDIEKSIADNLSEVQKVTESHREKIEREESLDKREADEKGGRLFPFPLFHRSEKDVKTVESVSLYKNDVSAVFTPSDQASEDGYESWTYKKEIEAAKINGLITGVITGFGDYVSVTVDLYVYPGAQRWATVTEVGMLSDPMDLSYRIVRSLIPKISNNLPVDISFDIIPHELMSKTVVTIDDVVYTSIPEHLPVDAGIHNIAIECEGYESVSTSYQFSGNEHYTVRTELVPKVEGYMNIRLKKYRDGVFYASGIEGTDSRISINGKAVLGIFIAEPLVTDESLPDTRFGRFCSGVRLISGNVSKFGSKIIWPEADNSPGESADKAFYYIPQNLVENGSSVVVNAKPYDRAQNIDKRRRHMYLAYSCLICSLPASFYCAGRTTSSWYAYAGYTTDSVDYSEVEKWQKRCYACYGVNAVFGVWTVIELFRYLKAANDVLPAKAKTDKSVIIQEEVQDGKN